MENYFDYKIRVNFNEVDTFGRMKLSAIMFHTQQSAGMHLYTKGYSYEFLRERDFVYVILRYQLKMSHYPSNKDIITIRTWYTGLNGATFLRFHKIYNEDGELIGEASGVWVVVSYSKRLIVKPKFFPYMIEPDTTQESSLDETPKCARTKDACLCITKKINYSDLDSNNHFTNTGYADLICDCINEIMEGKEIASFKICFVKEAKYNDILSVYVKKDGNKFNIGGDVLERPCFESETELRD